MNTVQKHFDENGYAKLPFQIDQETLAQLETEFEVARFSESPGKRGVSTTLDIAGEIKELNGLEVVRTIYFNKTTETNWFVPWHQDLTVALKQKTAHPDFKNWTVKEGIPHAEAPLSLLEQMVTLRIFLDPSDELNGGLWIMPGSHKLGRLKQNRIENIVNSGNKEICLNGKRGTAYLFSPLVLHRSGKSQSNNPRRCLQFEMAPRDSLPKLLEWFNHP